MIVLLRRVIITERLDI